MVYYTASETPPIFVLSNFRFVLNLVFSSPINTFPVLFFYKHIPLLFIVTCCDNGYLEGEEELGEAANPKKKKSKTKQNRKR